MNPTPLIIIAGPTAVGKTELSLELATTLGTEIISADSMQVYRYMDIGTAKPTPEEQQRVPHYLLDCVEPDQDFSVADYQHIFAQAIAQIKAKGKIPMMVGGTGLYIRACLQGFNLEPPGADPALREALHHEAEREGTPSLHQRLQSVDPDSAARIHPNDIRRVIRALEVFQLTGTPLSKLAIQKTDADHFDPVYLFLNRERDELYQRIEVRVDAMMAAGFLDEVKGLLDKGFSPQLKPMQSLGYQQLCDYLTGNIDEKEAVAQIKQQTRNYAKRQLSWFRREPVDRWFNLSNTSPKEFYGEILRYFEGRIRKASNKSKLTDR